MDRNRLGNIKMTKLLFVCHGNICRSPMAEFIFKKMISDKKLEKGFLIDSAATSTEEIGNDMHRGAKETLLRMNVPFSPKRARQITTEDYHTYDLLIGMDIENLYRMQKLWKNDPDNKVKLLLSYAGKDKDIADPWYTGDFDKTYMDLIEGCDALLKSLCQENA